MSKRRKGPPIPNPTHKSLKPDGGTTNKGSYYRRLEDIANGLKKIDEYDLPPGGLFMFLYYGCEKLGKGIIGIRAEWEADEAYAQSLPLPTLKAAATAMKLPVTDGELDVLFLVKPPPAQNTSARHLRNEIVHNFGPWNVENVVEHSDKLNMGMRRFLKKCTPAVLEYLDVNYAHLK